jgi:hypothetical protein
MNPMETKTKTLIVTETLRYEFTVPASMPENDDALKRFFASHPDPWISADFAAVTERDFEIETVEEDSNLDLADFAVRNR